ncbi:MAG: metallophosphoesterase family protein [Opitutaceae bacterium]
MAAPLTRILSDLHFGDHASRVDRLAQLRPLLDGVTHLVLNGDTLDTRAGPFPAHTAECTAAVRAFFPGEVASATFLTGNHDGDFSPLHHLDLANGKIFVTHGDIFFDDIVPWSHDAALISRRIAEEYRAVPAELHQDLDHRLAVFRRVAVSIPQRHQSERNKLKFALHYIADTLWPPLRIVRIMRAWRLGPQRAAELAQQHRPAAKFVLCGHTHRPGIWRGAAGVTVINTGSFCPPLGGYAVDVTEEQMIVRQVDVRAGEFRPGDPVAAFPLAAT